jgi:hypothetical protein
LTVADTVKAAVAKDEGGTHGSAVSDCTSELAAKRIELQRKCSVVEAAAVQADDFINQYIIEAVTGDLSYTYYIIEAVTGDLSYTYLRTVRGIPCGKNQFYEARRKFFYNLSKMRDAGDIKT